ncbi:MAG: ribosome small subunit-dependent GTPase A [Lachnospiraceae bacterium]|nr:ribosome small subunit-dependent GTPase A [Lachnospiraceae bacterium]
MPETKYTGKIVKGIGGFYYVFVPSRGQYECKAKGIFRNKKEKPLVGDECVIVPVDEETKTGNIVELLPRKSMLIRPEVANVDQALVIFAIKKPDPNFNLLDRFLIHMESRNLPCIICFNKEDLKDGAEMDEIVSAYEKGGYKVLLISAKEKTGIEEVRKLLAGKTTTVAGPSGVGKSSLINELLGSYRMETGTVSEKIDRGKHTTRHSEIFTTQMCGLDTYLFDTPGFSSLSVPKMEAKPLSAYYHEFDEFEPACRFAGCAHIKEKECGIKEAVKEGKINKLRYENYVQLFEEEKSMNRY